MDAPSTLVAPRSTRSGKAPPPPATSSSGGMLRELKSMFTWSWDTHQRQDVLLGNQRRQNEEFNEFHLPVPPLNDDPFASPSVIVLATMEAAPHHRHR
jgi:hypothetical protein